MKEVDTSKKRYVPQNVIDKIPEHLLKEAYLTREDLNLPISSAAELAAEIARKSVEGYSKHLKQVSDPELEEDYTDSDSDSKEDDPKPDADGNLPHGYAWSSYVAGSGDKDEIVALYCCICGVLRDHWPAQCPKRKLMSNQV